MPTVYGAAVLVTLVQPTSATSPVVRSTGVGRPTILTADSPKIYWQARCAQRCVSHHGRRLNHPYVLGSPSALFCCLLTLLWLTGRLNYHRREQLFRQEPTSSESISFVLGFFFIVVGEHSPLVLPVMCKQHNRTSCLAPLTVCVRYHGYNHRPA